MRLLVIACVALWAVPAYAIDVAVPELPAGEMSVEELQEPVVTPPATSKKIDIPAEKEKELAPNAPKEQEEAAPPAEPKAFNAVVLRGLNKVTARPITLNATFGTVMRFGNLEIIPHRCVERTMRGVPDSAALLEIWELKPDTSPTKLFQGWMFSSNQAASALEHPVYDVWVEKCEIKEIKE